MATSATDLAAAADASAAVAASTVGTAIAGGDDTAVVSRAEWDALHASLENQSRQIAALTKTMGELVQSRGSVLRTMIDAQFERIHQAFSREVAEQFVQFAAAHAIHADGGSAHGGMRGGPGGPMSGPSSKLHNHAMRLMVQEDQLSADEGGTLSSGGASYQGSLSPVPSPSEATATAATGDRSSALSFSDVSGINNSSIHSNSNSGGGASGSLGLSGGSGSLGLPRSAGTGSETGQLRRKVAGTAGVGLGGDSKRQSRKADLLLVEDVKVSQKVAQRTLKQMSYTVAVADTGESALAKYKQHIGSLRILLMDINLGDGMSGVEATTLIREYERTHMKHNPDHESIIILGLTGNVDDTSMSVYKDVGMNGCILKGTLLKVGLAEALVALERDPSCFFQHHG